MPFTAFEVYVNGERLCLAGGPNVSVLAGTLTLSRRHPDGDDRVVEFRMGGMSAPQAGGEAEHLEWCRIDDVAVGTEITVKVVRTSDADSPSKQYVWTPRS